MELKDSRTLENLYAAFAGETQAWGKYGFFEAQAKKDGYQQIASIFHETAKNEGAHAKIWFKYIMGGIGTTEQQKRRALTRSPINSRWWPRSRNPMRSAIKSCTRTSKRAKFSPETKARYGSAKTAAISIRERRPRKSARSARMQRRISRSRQRTIKTADWHQESGKILPGSFFLKTFMLN